MKFSLALALAFLATHLPTTHALAFPKDGTPTISASASPTPSVLLFPFQSAIEVVQPTFQGLKSFGYIAPTFDAQDHFDEGLLWTVKDLHGAPPNDSNVGVWYFDQKEPSGIGYFFSLPFYFSGAAFALAFNSNHSISASPVYMSTLVQNDGFVGIQSIPERHHWDPNGTYVRGIANGLGGIPTVDPVVWSVDEKKSPPELWVSTHGKSLPFLFPYLRGVS